MTYGRETLNVKRETSLAKRISLRSLDVSRFMFHEQRGHSQAGF
jgi:hypothetical protein